MAWTRDARGFRRRRPPVRHAHRPAGSRGSRRDRRVVNHVHTSTTIAWEIPGTAATLLLKQEDGVWRLQRAGRPLGTRSTLEAGIEFAEQYMCQRPEGGR